MTLFTGLLSPSPEESLFLKSHDASLLWWVASCWLNLVSFRCWASGIQSLILLLYQPVLPFSEPRFSACLCPCKRALGQAGEVCRGPITRAITWTVRTVLQFDQLCPCPWLTEGSIPLMTPWWPGAAQVGSCTASKANKSLYFCGGVSSGY